MKKLVFCIKFAKLFYSEFSSFGKLFILLQLCSILYDLPGGSDSKESSCSAGDLGLILRLGRSSEGGHGNLPQYSCLENPHGQRSLAGYSPRGHKELDTTGQLSTYLPTGRLHMS